MKLNPSCVRAILMYVEDHIEFGNFVAITKERVLNSEIPLTEYDYKEIVYHVDQCQQSGFISNVRYYEGGDIINVYNMTPEGHEFIENIRNKTVFKQTLSRLQTAGIFTLKSMYQVGSAVATEYLKRLI